MPQIKIQKYLFLVELGDRHSEMAGRLHSTQKNPHALSNRESGEVCTKSRHLLCAGLEGVVLKGKTTPIGIKSGI